MKELTLAALAAVAVAVDTETLSNIMQQFPQPFYNQLGRSHNVGPRTPFNR